MFYAEQKEYPYGFVTDANLKDISISEDMNENVLKFKTRKQADKFFAEAGWIHSLNIKSEDEIHAQIYRRNEWVDSGNFDNKEQLKKTCKKIYE